MIISKNNINIHSHQFRQNISANKIINDLIICTVSAYRNDETLIKRIVRKTSIVLVMATQNQYVIVGELGKGQFGKVYEVVNQNNQSFAMKMAYHNKANQASRAHILRKQADILNKARGHPNIIQMKDFIINNKKICIILQKAETDLATVIATQGKLAQTRIQEIGRHIVDAMLFLKSKGIIHRDLKPQNILFLNGIIKLCDFGFAEQIYDESDKRLVVKGTPLYMSPEVLRCRPISEKTDVWAFGIVLYELFTGRTPFYVCDHAKLIKMIEEDPINFPDDMSDQMINLLQGMLKKDIRERMGWQAISKHPFFPKNQKIDLLWRSSIYQPIEKRDQPNCYQIIEEIQQFQDNRYRNKQTNSSLQLQKLIMKMFRIYCRSKKGTNAFKIMKILDLLKDNLIAGQQQSFRRQSISLKQQNQVRKQLLSVIAQCTEKQSNQGLLYAQCSTVIIMISKLSFNDIQIIQIALKLIKQELARDCSSAVADAIQELANRIAKFIYEQNGSIQLLLNSHIDFKQFLKQIANNYNGWRNKWDYRILECLSCFIHPQIKVSQTLKQQKKDILLSWRKQVVDTLIGKSFMKLNQNHSNLKFKLMIQCLQQSQDARKQYCAEKWNNELQQYPKYCEFVSICNYILNQKDSTFIYPRHFEFVQQISNKQIKPTVGHFYQLYFAAKHFQTMTSSAKAANNISRQQMINCLILLKPTLKDRHSYCVKIYGAVGKNGDHLEFMMLDIMRRLAVSQKQQLNQQQKTHLAELAKQLIQLQLKYEDYYWLCQLLVTCNQSDHFSTQTHYEKFKKLIKTDQSIRITNKDVAVWGSLFQFVILDRNYTRKQMKVIAQTVSNTTFWDRFFNSKVDKRNTLIGLIFISNCNKDWLGFNNCEQCLFLECFQQKIAKFQHSKDQGQFRKGMLTFLIRYFKSKRENKQTVQLQFNRYFELVCKCFPSKLQKYCFNQDINILSLMFIAQLIKTYSRQITTSYAYKLISKVIKIANKSSISAKQLSLLNNQLLSKTNNKTKEIITQILIKLQVKNNLYLPAYLILTCIIKDYFHQKQLQVSKLIQQLQNNYEKEQDTQLKEIMKLIFINLDYQNKKQIQFQNQKQQRSSRLKYVESVIVHTYQFNDPK